MSKLIAVLMVAVGLCFVPLFTSDAADNDAPPKKDLPTPKEPKPKKPKTEIEWTELKLKGGKGTLMKPEYKAGQQAKAVEPTKVEFQTEAAMFRIKWKTEPAEGKRGGAMNISLYKKESRGDKETWKRADRLGSARGESEGGSKPLTLGKGEYYLELEGDAIKYEITVEEGAKKEAASE